MLRLRKSLLAKRETEFIEEGNRARCRNHHLSHLRLYRFDVFEYTVKVATQTISRALSQGLDVMGLPLSSITGRLLRPIALFSRSTCSVDMALSMRRCVWVCYAML